MKRNEGGVGEVVVSIHLSVSLHKLVFHPQAEVQLVVCKVHTYFWNIFGWAFSSSYKTRTFTSTYLCVPTTM